RRASGGAAAHRPALSFARGDRAAAPHPPPAPPVARLKRLSVSVHWRALLHGAVVANVEFARPEVYVDLAHFRAEERDPKPVTQKGWQEALESIYPFKINQLVVADGDVRYQDKGQVPPLHLSSLNIAASNIRTVHSRSHDSPAPIRVEAVVFDAGHLRLDGHADFLAEPHLGLKANIDLANIPLGYAKPIAERYNVTIRAGVVSAAGTVEYAPD